MRAQRALQTARDTDMTARIVFLVMLMTISAPALAYIGPGAGITLFSSIWGIIVAAVVGLFAILRWPFRYMWRRMMRKSRKDTPESNTAEATSSDTSSDQ